MAKKAIVMGATSGIGMEVAKLLAAKGWQVGIAGRRIERLQALISQSGITCYQQIDVTPPYLYASTASRYEYNICAAPQSQIGRAHV